MSRISDLYVQRGNALARGQEQSGAIWGNTVANLGERFSFLPEQIQAGREAERAKQTAQAEDDALRSLFSREQPPSPEELIRTVGPERGLKLAEGLQAFTDLRTKKVTDARTTAGRLALGLKQLSPELRAALAPAVRQAAIEGGLGDASTIPEDLNDQFLDGVIAWGTGTEPKKPEAPKPQPLMDRGKLGVFDPNVAAYVPGTAAPEEAPKAWTPTGNGPTPAESLALELGYKDEKTGRPMTERLTRAQIDAAERRSEARRRLSEPKTEETVTLTKDGKQFEAPKSKLNDYYAQGWTKFDVVAERQKQGDAREKSETDTLRSTARSTIADLADELADDDDLTDISGSMFNGSWREWVPGNAEALRKYNELLAKLTLERRGDFKGQGAVSNYEQQTVERAVGLTRNTSTADLRKKLKAIASEYRGGAGGGAKADPMGIR